ncbi:hypothetical protein BJ170DRAFT_591170 [Xylariales sp. AK1849]|nr:hypothetical protein BJ170DRAFT_591170 [Xylariales sp. AK1849]
MFCITCGVSLPDHARFCSSCGTPVPTGPGSTPSHSSPAQSSPSETKSPYSASSVYSIPGSGWSQPISRWSRPPSSALVRPGGRPTEAFQQLAGAIFHTLDRNVEPKCTGGLEVSKMSAYAGYALPPYWAEYIVPTYAAIIPIELIPGQAPAEPVLSRHGWNQYLFQKIIAEPQTTYFHLTRLCGRFGIPFKLSMSDFPLLPDPTAQAKENRFSTEIMAFAQRRLVAAERGSGAFGGIVSFGGIGSFGGMGRSGTLEKAFSSGSISENSSQDLHGDDDPKREDIARW